MVVSISCVSTSHSATCRLVCRLRPMYARMTTRFLVSGATIAQTSWARAVQTLPAVVASLLLCQALRPIASLTLNGAQCISSITIRPRISRYDCTKIVRTSSLILSSAPCSPAAINSMSRACRDLTTPLPRTSAMLARRPQARALIHAQVVERRHLRRQPQRQRQPRQQPR